MRNRQLFRQQHDLYVQQRGWNTCPVGGSRVNNIKRFIHVSTDEVYGEQKEGEVETQSWG